ncbi:MAG: ABC transporter permease subunit [Pseudomonadales bacterium]|nr:ABC transporter permease subunit [Pseudomonadales bacterium]
MSPLNKRRLQNFRNNRRGYYSLFAFTVLFVISLFAEFIANDKPIVMDYQDRLYFPVWVDYLETDLGGDLELSVDFRDPYILAKIQDEGWAIWPPIRFSHDTVDWELGQPAPAPPSARHLLGTDALASDIVAKLIYGFRLSVLFGLSLTLFASLIGVTVGAVQGYFGGKIDLVGQRIVEIWSGLPILFVLIILASLMEPNVYILLIILIFFSWMALVGVVRAEFLRARNLEFVRAARALGTSNLVIMRRHVLPNAAVAALTYVPFLLNGSITTLTALDFLNFGLPFGSPSLGHLLAQAKANLHAPWIGITVFLTLGTMLTLLIFVGEAVRDAFDPRKLSDNQV